MTTVEANFDGLPGPTHNYAGLSWGNVASKSHGGRASNPRAAALQGLEKMRSLHDRGFVQGVLPPHERPHMATLRRWFGHAGPDAEVLEKAWNENPAQLAVASSASCMWTANAGTVSPSADTADGRVHFTPANLCAMPHRAIEHPVTGRVLQAVFNDPDCFAHHDALPSLATLGDEGAANHTRFCTDYGAKGVNFFVYGRHALNADDPAPTKFPARQTLEASRAIARHHGLDLSACVFAQQSPDLIDAGVFHNDVISVGNGPVLFHYEDAFVDTPKVLEELKRTVGEAFEAVAVPSKDVPLADVIKSYLFNSQLLMRPDGDGMMLLLPTEAEETLSVKAYLDALPGLGTSIKEVVYMDLRQSMANGGGPACLRLRVVLTEAERNAANQSCLFSPALHDTLKGWVETHYRDRLEPYDLRDPRLLLESRTALDELTQILSLGSVYDFQRI